MPVFSIIVPLFEKYKEYYKDLLDGIIGQTFKDYECLFIYYDLFFSFENDVRFKYIKAPKDDVCCKRNIGIGNAKGKYIIFCDSDDVLSHSMLSIYNDVINEFKTDYICPLFTREYEYLANAGLRKISTTFVNSKNKLDDYIFGRYLRNQPAGKHPYIFSSASGKAYKLSIIESNNIRFYEPPSRSEDMIFGNEYMLHANNMVLLDSCLYYWRMNTSSVMFDTNSFFYSINPFISHFTNQIMKVDSKYRVDLNYYLSKIILSTVHNLYRALLLKKITEADFDSKIIPITDPNGSSMKLLKQKTQLTGFRKLYRILLLKKRYGILKLIEYVHLFVSK